MRVVDRCRAVAQDVRQGARALRREPAVSAVVVLMIGLGIGAVSTILSVVNAVLLDPLAFRNPERLVRLWESSPARGIAQAPVSVPNFRDWQEQTSTLEQIAASEMATFNLTGDGDPERLPSARLTANLVPTLGVTPALGRNFLPEEEGPGQGRVALLGHGLWERRFGGDRSLIGKTVRLDGESYVIVGVMPRGFDFPGGRELWVPLVIDTVQQPWRSDRTNRNLAVFARLKPGVSVGEASRDMNAVARRLDAGARAANAGWGVYVRTFRDWMIPEPIRRGTLILFGAVVLLLLLACANVANLLLARAVASQRESATCAALGATRSRLIQQFMVQSAVLAGFGGLLGLCLAFWATGLLKTFTLPEVASLRDATVDWRVFGFTWMVALAAGLLFGAAPAWWASRPNLVEKLREGGSAGSGRSTQRLRGGLVAAQIGLTVVILTGAALLVRTFVEIQRLPLGFSSDNLLTFQINLPGARYGSQEQRVDFYDRWLQRLRGVPGIIGASATTHPPYSSSDWKVDIAFEGADSVAGRDRGDLTAVARAITSDYFRTIGTPIVRGREFMDRERNTTDLTLIVSESFARRYWPGTDPIGKRIRPGSQNPFGTVVGVAGDVRSGLEEAPEPAIYFHYNYVGMPSLAVVAHTAADPQTFIGQIRHELRGLDPDLPAYNVMTVEQSVSRATARPRFYATLLTLLGVTALLIAASGTYSMIAYAIRQRRKETAIRVALGAGQHDVSRVLVGASMSYVVIGVAGGLIGALLLTRAMEGLLFRVKAVDPLAFTSIPLALLGLAFLACYVPARRAARVTPSGALRHD